MIIILEFHGLQVFVDHIHEILPDPSGPGSALKVSHAFRSVAAYPDCCRVIMSKSAEPSVLGLISRTGLTCAGHSVIQSQAAAGSPAFFHYALQHTDHFSGRVLVIDLGGSTLVCVDRIALVVIDPADAGRNAEFSVILDRGEAGCHLYGLDAICKAAQTRRQCVVGIHDHGKVHCFQLGKAIPGSYILIDLPGHCVKGSLHCFAQFDLAHVRTVIVLGSVLDLLILHICAGIIALLKSRRINNERLDRASGLSVALECAVERKSGVDFLGSAAYHSYNLACAVINADGRSLHLVLAVVGSILEISEFLIDTVLQFFLHIEVEGGIYFIAALKELSQAGVIQLVIDLIVSGALFVAGKIIAE